MTEISVILTFIWLTLEVLTSKCLMCFDLMLCYLLNVYYQPMFHDNYSSFRCALSPFDFIKSILTNVVYINLYERNKKSKIADED